MHRRRAFAVLVAALSSTVAGSADAEERTGCSVDAPGPLDEAQARAAANLTCSELARLHGNRGRYRITVVPNSKGLALRIGSPDGATTTEVNDVDDLFATIPELVGRVVTWQRSQMPPMSASEVETCNQGNAHVRFVSKNERAVLYRIARGSTDSTPVCEGPCEVDLPICDQYQIGSDGHRTTNLFALEAKNGENVLLESKDNGSNRSFGTGLVIAGSILPVVGLVLIAQQDHDGDKMVQNAGAAALVGGLLCLAGGLGILASGHQGTVEQARIPTWKPAPEAASATFPLSLSGTF